MNIQVDLAGVHTEQAEKAHFIRRLLDAVRDVLSAPTGNQSEWEASGRGL